jgi:glycosyltransferase involved in cell wall biosynthesis
MNRSTSMPWRVCTIAARNYLGSVCLLARSFAAHHPGIPFSALIVDAHPEEFGDHLPFEVLTLADLELPRETLAQMQTYYDVTELSTALKPAFLELLLARGDHAVMYLDPDIEVFAPLHDLFELAATHDIVLTPHVTQPVPRDGLAVAEEAFLISGQFNLGFIAVSRRAGAFLDYWRERTRLHAIVDPAHGYFTDQRWVDAVPALFDHHVVRDLGCNVAYWNLHERPLALVAGGNWTAGGAPLRFFHYSGHDARMPLRLSKHLVDPPRVRVDQEPALRQLLKERAQRILDAHPGDVDLPYGFDRTPDGIALSPETRRLYWEAVRDAEEVGDAAPPNAFAADGGQAFARWLARPVSPAHPVSRYLYGHWKARADLQREFPDPLGANAHDLLDWSRVEPSFISIMPSRLTPPLATERALHGVNLVGYLSGEFGVGAASRMVARMIRASGVPLATTTLYTRSHLHGEDFPTTIEGAPFNLSILSMNADDLVRFADSVEFAAHRERRRVGVWYWEVGDLPAAMRRASSSVDEIWCATEHVRNTLVPWVDKPVHRHPLLFEIPSTPTAMRRSDLGLPDDRFLFGFVFDYASAFRRKNPLGLLEAYLDAFGPHDGATLVLKAIHAERHPELAACLHEAADGRDDVLLIDRHFDGITMRALYQLLDAYVSLHRSEGLGLTIAAAMAAGIPAIATGWSGNLEFMNETNSVLVPATMVPVGDGAEPYDPNAWWAEPDLHAAAASMRRLFEHPDEANELGARGRASLIDEHSTECATAWFSERFEQMTGLEAAS